MQEARLALGVAHRDYERGDYGSARRLQKQALAARSWVLGEGHRDTLSSMNNLAATLHEHGNLEGARKLQEQVLTASSRVLGEDHPNTIQFKNNLAQMNAHRQR